MYSDRHLFVDSKEYQIFSDQSYQPIGIGGMCLTHIRFVFLFDNFKRFKDN